MKNWLPTLGGILSALGLTLTALPLPALHAIGLGVAALGTVITGASAKQFNVTGGTVSQTPEAEKRVEEAK